MATKPRKGRGSLSNDSSRFLEKHTEIVDDGWYQDDEALSPDPRTEIFIDHAKKIISHNRSPDVPFNASINPYKGCEHGCCYCFARPTHAYLDLSPGLDFETKLFAKPDAATLLRKELQNPRYQVEAIALGANTDAYQPIERKLRITRSILEVLHEFRHPVSIITKSALVERDIDILSDMASMNLAKVVMSITALDTELSRRMEPRATAPHRRIEAVQRLSAHGIPVSVLFAPVIPAINDQDMEQILERAHVAGARSAGYVILRLPHELKQLFQEWLETHYPLKAKRVMNIIREMREGREYNSEYGLRQTGTGVFAEIVARRFRAAVDRLSLNQEVISLDASLFRRTTKSTSLQQLDMFE